MIPLMSKFRIVLASRLTAVSAFAAALVYLLPLASHAQAIAQWTFETSQPFGGGGGNWFTNVAAEVGVGTGSAYHSAGNRGATTPAGNGSAHSLSTSNWVVGDFYQFTLSTVGYSGLRVSFDITSSNTGPGAGLLQYSTDGASFTGFGSGYAILANASPNPVWNSSTYNPVYTVSYDLSSVPELDNAVRVYFRLVDTSTTSANGGIVGATGTERVDNFTVAVVPEPQGLLVIAVLLPFMRRIFKAGR
jgi:hypothetical protein